MRPPCIVRLSEIGTGLEPNFRQSGCGRGSESLIPPSTAHESEIWLAAGAYLRQSHNNRDTTLVEEYFCSVSVSLDSLICHYTVYTVQYSRVRIRLYRLSELVCLAGGAARCPSHRRDQGRLQAGRDSSGLVGATRRWSFPAVQGRGSCGRRCAANGAMRPSRQPPLPPKRAGGR